MARHVPIVVFRFWHRLMNTDTHPSRYRPAVSTKDRVSHKTRELSLAVDGKRSLRPIKTVVWLDHPGSRLPLSGASPGKHEEKYSDPLTVLVIFNGPLF